MSGVVPRCVRCWRLARRHHLEPHPEVIAPSSLTKGKEVDRVGLDGDRSRDSVAVADDLVVTDPERPRLLVDVTTEEAVDTRDPGESIRDPEMRTGRAPDHDRGVVAERPSLGKIREVTVARLGDDDTSRGDDTITTASSGLGRAAHTVLHELCKQ